MTTGPSSPPDRVERLPSAAFDDLAQALVDEGLDPEVVGDPAAREWLDWWTEGRYLTRAGATGLALMVQAERDRALAEAIRLARSAATQADLFALLEEEKAADRPSAALGVRLHRRRTLGRGRSNSRLGPVH